MARIRSTQSNDSLPLALDLIHYWASPTNGIIRHSDRSQLWRMVYDIAFDQYTNGPALQRVTHADAPHDLIGLVNFPGTEVPVDGPIGVQNWSWLGPALLDGLRDAPDVFAEKIANLIAAGRQSPDDPKVHTYPVVPENLKSLFNEHSQEVINRLVRQRDRASDHIQKTIDQIVKSTQESVS